MHQMQNFIYFQKIKTCPHKILMLGAVIEDFSTAHMQSAQISQINLGLRGLKGNSHQKISVANIIELLLKSFLVYHSPMCEVCKVPKRPVEVSCDVTQHLVAYRTAVETRTNSSGMRSHAG